MHRCVDDLITENKIDFDSYSSDIEWTRIDFEKARNFTQNLYKDRVKAEGENFKLQGIPADIQQALENCYNVRKEQIFQAQMKDSLLENGIDVVENFDWKVKWIMGTSKMASLREPLLQVNLHCASNNKLEFEADLEKLDCLIAELERAKSALTA